MLYPTSGAASSIGTSSEGIGWQKRRDLYAALLLLSNSLFLSLRLTGNPGSFPRPLPPEEERACLERWAQGDLEARNRLVEHNLRLVAHIIKKM